MTSGFNIFYEISGTWYLLSVRVMAATEPTLTINGSTEVSINVPAKQYSLMATFTKAAIGGTTAIYLAYTAPGITASTMNSNFDSVIKFFHGRIYSVRHDRNSVVIKAKEITNKWLCETILLDSNIVSNLVVNSYDQVHKLLAFDASTGLANNRGVRIMTPKADKIHHASATWTSSTIGGGISGFDSGAETDLDTNDSLEWIQERTSTSPVYAYLELTLTPSTWPIRMDTIRVWFKGDLFWSGAKDSWFSQPRVDFWDYNLRYYVEFQTFDTNALNINATYTITSNYLDPSTHVIKMKIDGGEFCYQTTHHGVHCAPQFVELQYDEMGGTIKHEYMIMSVAGNVATIDETPNSDIDCYVDVVDILYSDEDFCNSLLPLDTRINSVVFNPNAVRPAYYNFNFMPVTQYITDVGRRYNAYWRASRHTTSGKVDISIEAKASPPDEGLLIEPTNTDWSAAEINWNSEDACRGVIVKNKSTSAGYSLAGAYPANAIPDGDLKIIRLYCLDIPDNELGNYAESVFNARNAISDDIVVPIKSVQIYEETGTEAEETFKSYAENHRIRNENGWDNWATSAGSDFTAVTTSGNKRGHLVAIAGHLINMNYSFSIPQPVAGSGSFSFKLNNTVYPSSIASSQGYAGGVLRVGIYWTTDGSIMARNGAGWTDTTINMALGTEYMLLFTFSDANTYTITINGTVKGPYSTSSANALTLIYFNQISDCEYYLDDIDASWITTPVYAYVTHDVRDAPDDKFYPGARIWCNGAPTTLEGGDFQVYDYFTIRAIKFLNNERALLYLGYAEATATSPDVMMENILLRHDYNSTS